MLVALVTRINLGAKMRVDEHAGRQSLGIIHCIYSSSPGNRGMAFQFHITVLLIHILAG